MAGTRLGGDAAFGGSAVPTGCGRRLGRDGRHQRHPDDRRDARAPDHLHGGHPGARLRGQAPKAKSAAPEKEERVTVGIDATGKFFVDDKPVADAELEQKLREAYAKRPDDHILYLKADGGSSYSRTLTALDAARNAGVRRIGAITERPSGGAPAAH
jgi:hypothetical protein